MTQPFAVAAFYLFVPFNDPEALQRPLLESLERLNSRGTVLLAPEGINGTLSMPAARYEDVLRVLRALPGCANMCAKRSHSSKPAFRRLKVRLKREIVTLGVPGVDPNARVGTYVAPEDWNAVISDRETLVVDARNEYEVQLGTFQGAENPATGRFGEFPAWLEQAVEKHKPKRIAMFCTGGIRCEKATSYAKQLGMDEVYHLEGGILSYLSAIPEEQSLWRGECFVFDERVALAHGLVKGDSVLCRACKFPVSADGQAHPHFEPGVSCPNCFGQTSDAQKARFAERQRQVELAEACGRAHLTGR